MQNGGDVGFINLDGLANLKSGSTAHELHDDPQLGPLEVRAVVLSDVGTVALWEDANLLLNVLQLVQCLLQVDALDGDWTQGPFVYALEDLSEGAPTYFLVYIIQRFGIYLLQHNKRRWKHRKHIEGSLMDANAPHYIFLFLTKKPS